MTAKLQHFRRVYAAGPELGRLSCCDTQTAVILGWNESEGLGTFKI